MSEAESTVPGPRPSAEGDTAPPRADGPAPTEHSAGDPGRLRPVIDRMTEPVPAVLRTAAAWSWRLVVVGYALIYLLKFLSKLYLVTLPVFAALLLTALLRPVVRWLRRHRVPRALATWGTLILAFAVLGGVGFFVVNRTSNDYPTLVAQVGTVTDRLTTWLTHAPLHLRASQVTHLQTQFLSLLQRNQQTVVAGVVTGLTLLVHLLASTVLAFFVTFFLLYDGENIWRWLVSAFPATTRRGINIAGRQAWNRLAGYVKGTFVIACFHAIVVTTTLLILGVPLVAPLGALVFVGSFLPIVGALIFGGLAVIVALITKGAVAAIVLVIVLVADNQIEAHVLQPFLVGRFLRLHPLAVVLAVATGGYLAGIIGAILALPMTAVATAVVGYYVAENRLHKEGIAPDPLVGA